MHAQYLWENSSEKKNQYQGNEFIYIQGVAQKKYKLCSSSSRLDMSFSHLEQIDLTLPLMGNRFHN